MAIDTDTQFHVLAVDDSIIDRKLIERLLKTSSYQVTTVDSGSKALEFLGLQDEQRNSHPSVSSDPQEIEVNLIITDYCMPGMTGYDLLKKIKESSSLKDIPVVIMSSENVPSRISRCLEEGAEEFFLKPVQLSDMKRLKSHLLKGKSKPISQPPPQDHHHQQPPPQEHHHHQHQPPQGHHHHQQQEQQEHQQQQQENPQKQEQSPPASLQPETATHQQQQQQPNSKRKPMEGSLSPDSSRRPRYSGLTVV